MSASALILWDLGQSRLLFHVDNKIISKESLRDFEMSKLRIIAQHMITQSGYGLLEIMRHNNYVHVTVKSSMHVQ